MSAYNIARTAIDAALVSARQDGFDPADVGHALLISAVESYKSLRGIEDTRAALEFQLNNLSDDLDYEFMRP